MFSHACMCIYKSIFECAFTYAIKQECEPLFHILFPLRLSQRSAFILVFRSADFVSRDETICIPIGHMLRENAIICLTFITYKMFKKKFYETWISLRNLNTKHSHFRVWSLHVKLKLWRGNYELIAKLTLVGRAVFWSWNLRKHLSN